MNVVLINPPNHQHDVDDLAPPLGLLMLAQSLIGTGTSVKLIDLNLDSSRGRMPPASDFYPLVCERILALDPDIVCFTSMGINSHVSLKLGRQVKLGNPSVVTVFGGPHFGSIATELKREFPWVDYVNVGVGENSIRQFITSLQRGGRPSSFILGQETPSQAMQQLHHPWAAYDLIDVDEYFSLNPRRVLNFETGRGCKFKCKFCYSPSHWRERFDFELPRVVKDFSAASQSGANHLFLVQDNLLNDRSSAAALCLNLADISSKPTWNCYGTLRDVDEEIADYLARGGCNGIYIGIDAVTPAQKRQFGKSSFNQQSECLEKIQALVIHSVIPTCAFILDPLKWSDEELEATFRLATMLRLNGAELSLHFLIHYSNTGLSDLEGAPVPDDFRIRLMFDCPDVVAENPFVKSCPSLFPFHTRNVADSARYRRAVAMIHLAQYLISKYPYEISDLVASTSSTIVDLLRTIHDSLRPSLWREPALTREAAMFAFEEMICKKYGFTPTTSIVERNL